MTTPKRPNVNTSGKTKVHSACAAWAALLPDAAEDLLSGAEREALDKHVLTCDGCAWELADAQRGAAWLGLLKGHVPEPPAHLLSSILERTSWGEENKTAAAESALRQLPSLPELAGEQSDVWLSAGIAPNQLDHVSRMRKHLRRWLGLSGVSGSLLQPRLAMTTSMAFFSICLTLNLLGISVRKLPAESLSPAGLQRTVADTGASLVRSFEGNRVVYRVESRVNEWRTASSAGDSLPLELHPTN